MHGFLVAVQQGGQIQHRKRRCPLSLWGDSKLPFQSLGHHIHAESLFFKGGILCCQCQEGIAYPLGTPANLSDSRGVDVEFLLAAQS